MGPPSAASPGPVPRGIPAARADADARRGRIPGGTAPRTPREARPRSPSYLPGVVEVAVDVAADPAAETGVVAVVVVPVADDVVGVVLVDEALVDVVPVGVVVDADVPVVEVPGVGVVVVAPVEVEFDLGGFVSSPLDRSALSISCCTACTCAATAAGVPPAPSTGSAFSC
jgi:hypothetical protein